jgi:hypothetical protein
MVSSLSFCSYYLKITHTISPSAFIQLDDGWWLVGTFSFAEMLGSDVDVTLHFVLVMRCWSDVIVVLLSKGMLAVFSVHFPCVPVEEISCIYCSGQYAV